MVKSLSGRQYDYFGSEKLFYSGIALGSTANWTFVNFSGTNTNFGPHANTENNRFAIVSSGNSYAEWAWGSRTTMPQAGELWGGNGFTQDGVAYSGVWIRSNVASQKIQIWSW